MLNRLALAAAIAIGSAAFAQPAQPKVPEKQPTTPAKKEEKPKPKTYVTVEECPADFKLQGEYGAADAGKASYGVQIIALEANPQFRAVIYPGGLPGAGWNGDKKTRIEIDGKLENGKVVFDGNGWKGVADGTTLHMAKSDMEFELKRIERTSPTLGMKPPQGAKVLFASAEDAKKNFKNGHEDARGLLAAGCVSNDKFGDHTLHLEFLLPFKPGGRGQDRGNSGVYLQDRYELQVLDSFALKGANNECGGFYQQHEPSVNMCYPPLQWQTYDIDFTAAKFDESGKKTATARVTVRHNGVVIHDNVELKNPTPGGGLTKKDDATPGPMQLQGHGNPVYFRNIWVVEKK